MRYYGTRGLLAPAGRTSGRFRKYDADVVRAVRFVKRAQHLGFTLEAARDLLHLRQGGSRRQVRALAELKLADIEARMRDRGAMGDALRALVETCRCDEESASAAAAATPGHAAASAAAAAAATAEPAGSSYSMVARP